MAKITEKDVADRTRHLSASDVEGLQAVSNFLNDGDESMAWHILSGLGKGAKTVVKSLFALKKNREKEEKKK